jgi:hypothetical protein
VRREQVVRERVERRDRGDDEQQTTGGERGDPPALRRPSADGERVRDGEREDGERCLEMRRPRIWVR